MRGVLLLSSFYFILEFSPRGKRVSLQAEGAKRTPEYFNTQLPLESSVPGWKRTGVGGRQGSRGSVDVLGPLHNNGAFWAGGHLERGTSWKELLPLV